jgi:hypothetical protein
VSIQIVYCQSLHFNHTSARISKGFHKCSYSSKNPSPIPFFICLNDACPNIPLKLIFPIHCLRHPGFAAGVLYPAIQDIKSGPAIAVFPLTSSISLSLCMRCIGGEKKETPLSKTQSRHPKPSTVSSSISTALSLAIRQQGKKRKRNKEVTASSIMHQTWSKKSDSLRRASMQPPSYWQMT